MTQETKINPEEATTQTINDTVENNNDCKKELDTVKDQLLRLTADFHNYKRRVETDRSNWSFSAKSQIILDVLPVIDDFDRALQEAQREGVSKELGQWLAGFELIHKRLYDFLKSAKVTEIEQVTMFDPELHEALMQVEDVESDSGTIVQVLQKGFMLDGKVIRAAKVSVAK